MAAKSQQFGYDLLRLIFNATSLDKIAEDNSVDGVTEFWFGLHTADPGVGGNQTSSETNYVGYARQSVNRTAAALPVTNVYPPIVKTAADIIFADIGAGSAAQVLTHWSLGLADVGVGEVLYKGPITPTLPIQAGQSGPVLAAGTNVTEV